MRIFVIIIVALIVRLTVSYFQLHSPNFYIQQDSYVDYATMLSHGTINNTAYFDRYNTRLFPGYPVLILLLTKIIGSPIFAGYLISLVSSLAAIYLFWKLTKNTIFTLVFSIFPPIWVEQATKVATEPLTVFLLLAGLLLYRKNKFFLTGLILGFATDVRLISACLFFAIIFQLLITKRWNKLITVAAGFSILILSLVIYNYLLFGNSEVFRQFIVYPVTTQAKLGIFQITSDITRNIRNHEYRVLISGFLYLIFSFWGMVKLYKHRKSSNTVQLLFYWVLFSLIFILSYGPSQLFEDFRRFIVPIIPALIYGILL